MDINKLDQYSPVTPLQIVVMVDVIGHACASFVSLNTGKY